MDNRRFTALMLTMLFMWLWIQMVPALFPGLFPQQQQAQQAAQVGAPPQVGQADNGAPGVADPAVPQDLQPPPQHPHIEIPLGSSDPQSNYFLRLIISTQGASLLTAELNDPNFVTLDRQRQLSVVRPVETGRERNGLPEFYRTLTVSVPAIDAKLSDFSTSLATLDWEIVPGSQTESSVALQVEYAGYRVVKTFRLNEGDTTRREQDAEGYFVDVELEIINLSDASQTVDYAWQGPVGLPLENVFNARILQEVKLGALENHRNPEAITAVYRTAEAIVKQFHQMVAKNDPNQVDTWRDPLVYIGVDMQHFAALMVSTEDILADHDGDGQPDPVWKWARPLLVREDKSTPRASELSVQIQSREFSLAAAGTDGNSLKHDFRLYLGPKREALLDQFGAGDVINYGWFRSVSRLLVKTLNFFHHSLGLPFGLAIVLLTVVVRSLMFPISVKQAEVAKKQKELQPELDKIKERLKNEPEKFLRAQQELFRKHGHRPFVFGCLPALLQLPIFIGLYQGLDKAIDLRLARFLWIDNLAAPDALFHFPFEIWFLGREFNVLPFITVGLFLVQQKLFAPPPATEEQAMQMKIMNFMMVLMGFLFYHVPSGLCVYFITQSLWGIGERKLLDYLRPKVVLDSAAETGESTLTRQAVREESTETKSPTLWQRLQAAADQARQQSTLNNAPDARSSSSSTNGSSKEKRKSRRRK